ncbi:hypothetical protein MESS2_610056 [Mesorhizobium metallidurans STM 2683]|uniref:Uncharacterized protein n=1 Tax=Mesorhizobium metallidurans STM 2683 TaxID=1297569 RepID=M5EUB9_9HYPH|nr:hypothetical protein MESS2_610056 [Mesorhizobium metallidurans STM 2683]
MHFFCAIICLTQRTAKLLYPTHVAQSMPTGLPRTYLQVTRLTRRKQEIDARKMNP